VSMNLEVIETISRRSIYLVIVNSIEN